ncbi:F-box/WD repeat-containing protein 7 [Venturia canescens]|uniref:F-box/WD repeat-containing protein 7 n=1 Tax=Venturia canescens TaxID=32260 RepID=UPI001C9BF9CE|nr:F-box/WD repeat-containing protein 7 [Venturia canescens]
MSVPSSSSSSSSSSKGIEGEKPGGTSPSPVEGVEVGIAGPSTLEHPVCPLPQDGESEDYGNEADEEEDEEEEEDSSEEESEISDNGLYCDAECEEEVENEDCRPAESEQSQAPVEQRVQSPILHTCVPLNVVQPQRKRKCEAEPSLPCKKLNSEDKNHTLIVKKLEEKLKHVRFVIPTRDNPPPEMSSWLLQFQRWSNAERMLAIDELIERCEPTQVRHMMQVIEPQFQRDFISLLPKELALSVLAFLEPRDLLRAAQTCRNWRFLVDDNLLWKEKCRVAGIDGLKDFSINKRKNCRTHSGNCGSPWKQAYMRQHNIKMNWRTQPIRPPKVLKGHDDHVITCLQFSGNRIVSGSDDNTLKVWSAVTGKCLRTLVGHTGGVWSSQMSGTTVISGSTDRTLKVWNAETGQCIHTLYGHTSTVRCMHLHGNKVVSGSRDATLRVWQVDTGECLHVLVGHLAAVRCVQYDGKLVVSGAYDFMVKVWNPEREECLHTLQGHTNRVYSLQFDGVHVVSGSLDTSIRVWEVETGACRHTLMGHQSLTSGMELRNNILVSGNADSTVKVWDIVSGHCLQTLSGPNKHQSAVTCLQFNSHFVITSSDDGTVKLWDVKTGDFIRNLVALESGGSGGVVWRIRASDTKLVCAVGSRNGTEETKLLVLDFDVEVK